MKSYTLVVVVLSCNEICTVIICILHAHTLTHTWQSQNTLRVTHIIVPKQKGNSDSCETLCEEELFDVQDQYDLITLGWIHVGGEYVCLCVCVRKYG